MPLETTPWNVVDHLDTPERIIAYIEAALEEDDPALTKAALEDVAEALRQAKC